MANILFWIVFVLLFLNGIVSAVVFALDRKPRLARLDAVTSPALRLFSVGLSYRGHTIIVRWDTATSEAEVARHVRRAMEVVERETDCAGCKGK